MATKQSGPGLDAMVAGAAAVASAVSKDVSMKTLEAPETSRSFVALDRNDTGTVDKSGLPLVSSGGSPMEGGGMCEARRRRHHRERPWRRQPADAPSLLPISFRRCTTRS